MITAKTIKAIFIQRFKKIYILLLSVSLIAIFILVQYLLLRSAFNNLTKVKNQLEKNLVEVSAQYKDLKNQDQYKINKKNEEEIKNVKNGFKNTILSYEKIQDLKAQKQDTSKLEILYAQIVKDLSVFEYASAESKLNDLNADIIKATPVIVSNIPSTENIPSSNAPPSAGFSIQQVKIDQGAFNISIIAADLNSTRVIVDTASDSDCGNNCPALSLSDYVSRSGAFAGINGSFFCPPEYPSCSGKTNSFDTLLMNKNKKYFNSDNNVYSTVPLVVFKDNWARFMTQSLQWGRDTSIDSAIAMQPLLVFNNSVVYSGSDNSKFNAKGARDFIASKGNMVYIGVIYNATMADGANVLKALGMENALNLDEGGSSALWFNGYKAGPGRNIPNAVLFVRK